MKGNPKFPPIPLNNQEEWWLVGKISFIDMAAIIVAGFLWDQGWSSDLPKYLAAVVVLAAAFLTAYGWRRINMYRP